VDLKEIQVSAMSDGFAKAIEVCNTEITKAILGQTLSTTSKGSGMMGGSGVADLHGEVRSEWAQFDKRAYAQMQKDQIFDPYLKINGYKGHCRSVRGGMTPANLAVFSQAAQRLALAGVFFDPEAEQDLTLATGFKMRIAEPELMAGISQGKNDKSERDRKD
jgi:phage gp29-like protein